MKLTLDKKSVNLIADTITGRRSLLQTHMDGAELSVAILNGMYIDFSLGTLGVELNDTFVSYSLGRLQLAYLRDVVKSAMEANLQDAIARIP